MQDKSKKIILVLFYKHFEKKDIDMFDIAEMRKQGFDIEIWVLVKMSYNYNIDKPLHCYEGKEVIEFRTFGQLEERISKMNMKTSFFILYPGEAYDSVSNFVRKSIVMHKGKYANYHYSLTGVSDFVFENRNFKFFDIAREYFAGWRNNPYKLYSDFKIFINTFFYPSTYEFLQGEVGYSRVRNKFLRLSKKCVVLHSTDIDIYIRNKKKKINNELFEKKYAVFIDQYLVGHSDFKKEELKSPISSQERYYAELNSFFILIEKVYDCEIIIALHPKAEYVGNPFQGRTMLINQTHALMENAIFCILQSSECYSFALFLKKPYFQIITTDLKQDKLMNEYIMKYEQQGLSRVCDISSVDEERIKEYLNVYNADIHDSYVDYFMGFRNNSELLNMSVICQLIKKKLEMK